MKPMRRVFVLLCALFLIISLGAAEAWAVLRVGAGLGMISGDVVPMGRLVVDVLPLWFVTLSVDAEYWFFSAGSHQLLPFVAVSLPLIFHATVGAAPIVSISSQGIGLVQNTLAFKGGLGMFVGPLGLFSEALVMISAPETFVNGIFFAIGVTLGF